LAALVAVTPFALEWLELRYLSTLVLAGFAAITAIGLSILMGYAGQVSLGHAAFFGIGAYTSAVLTGGPQGSALAAALGLTSIPIALAALAGMGIAAAVALLVGLPSLRLKGHYLAMATLAIGIIVSIFFNEETWLTGGPDGLSSVPPITLLGAKISSMKGVREYFYLTWAAVVLTMVFAANLLQSKVGRALRSLHDSEAAAAGMGVNVASYKVRVFILSAVLASLAGSLYAHFQRFVNPSACDLNVSVRLLIMIVVGGMHSIWGALVGALLITLLQYEWLPKFGEYEVFVYGAILLTITIFLPKGLVSIPGLAVRALRRTARPKTASLGALGAEGE
jgi:branched-chain amino acid transport system permease protein